MPGIHPLVTITEYGIFFYETERDLPGLQMNAIATLNTGLLIFAMILVVIMWGRWIYLRIAANRPAEPVEEEVDPVVEEAEPVNDREPIRIEAPKELPRRPPRGFVPVDYAKRRPPRRSNTPTIH